MGEKMEKSTTFLRGVRNEVTGKLLFLGLENRFRYRKSQLSGAETSTEASTGEESLNRHGPISEHRGTGSPAAFVSFPF